MTRLFILVGVLGICGGMTSSNAWGVVPNFYNSLNDDPAITTANYGPNSQGAILPSADTSKHTYIAGVNGNNAFESLSDSGANYASWNNNAVTAIMPAWVNANGITVDLYFQGTNGVSDEGLWSMVKRASSGTGGFNGDQYFITSLRNGKLRILFTDEPTGPTTAPTQYKFTYDGTICGTAAGPCGSTIQEKVQNVNFDLVNGTVYHLTTSLKNGVFKVWLDDLSGNAYSNTSPIVNDNTTLGIGTNFGFPTSSTSGTTGAGHTPREMDIGNRGPNPNFGGTLRNGHWVDEVSVYNGEYSPADLIPAPVPGDYNGNLVVDAADYVLWRQQSGTTAAGLAADGSGPTTGTPDGTVDHYDYDFWRSRFGSTSGSGSGAGNGVGAGSAVPEPSMAVLVACACLTFAMRRSHSPAGRRQRSI